MTTEYLLKQYEASLRISGSHEAANQINTVVAKLKAADELANAAKDTIELCKHYGWPTLSKDLTKPLRAYRAAGKGDTK